MDIPTDPGVSIPAEPTAVPLAQGEPNPAQPSHPQPSSPPPAEPSKGGYDALPDYAKEIIGRNAEKARRAEAEKATLEQKMDTILQKLGQAPIDPDTARNIEELKRIAPQAGYVSREEVERLADEKARGYFDQLQQQQAVMAAEQELNSVLQKYDGKENPKVTREEIAAFRQKAETDPNLQYLTYAPFEALVQAMKGEELRQREIDRVLSAQQQPGVQPTKGAPQGTQPAPIKVPRLDNLSDVLQLIPQMTGQQ